MSSLKATGYFWTSHTALFEQGVIMSETILKPRSPHPPSFSLELWMASAWKAPVVVEEPWRGLPERNNRMLGFLCGPTLFSSCRKRDRIQISTLSLGIKVVSLEESPEVRDEQQSPYSVPLWCSVVWTILFCPLGVVWPLRRWLLKRSVTLWKEHWTQLQEIRTRVLFLPSTSLQVP